MRGFILALLSLIAITAAQNCGPKYSNQVCAAGKCCPFFPRPMHRVSSDSHPGSQYGWCDVGAAYCDPKTCLQKFSGKGSSCATQSTSTLRTTTKRADPTPYVSQIPIIDVCGNAQGGVSCPGAGLGGYFYRCCSSAGHCGPKNDIQDQNLYCGTGCQAGYGKCDKEAAPALPTGTPGTSGAGETCGPIVNKRCASGLCCSGSNFCGTGVSGDNYTAPRTERLTLTPQQDDFCGAANWCQKNWGSCS